MSIRVYVHVYVHCNHIIIGFMNPEAMGSFD